MIFKGLFSFMEINKGISPSKVFVSNGDKSYAYLIDFLEARFPSIPKKEWLARMSDGLVFGECGISYFQDASCPVNTYIYYYRRIDREEPIPFQESIIYQDDHLLIADKPHFLPVIPGGHYLKETLLVRLKNKTGIAELTPIHRIDRETAGLVAFSIKPESRGLYQAIFRERKVRKVYEAIAPYLSVLVNKFPIHYQSRIEESDLFIKMHEVAGEPNSDSVIKLIERNGDWARYCLELGSGRKHQLRLHMSSLGIPIKGDSIYPNLKPHVIDGKDFNNPLQLLAKSLSFIDPVTGVEQEFCSRQTLDL
jgi:tRNA pseudouridine32 synthase/23S rRNA pseudouridine746 synthase